MREEALKRRKHWVTELAQLSGSFGDDSASMSGELDEEIECEGSEALIDHLRLCGVVPEQYKHDSSEEKLYSKYTDAVVSRALAAMGLQSIVITARADSADVQARGSQYSLVADAKAFRLSRTAKNQKDFKIQALDSWRGDLDYALVVCPIYQLPTRTSQIYLQATSRNVCILSYSHLAALVALASKAKPGVAEAALGGILATVPVLPPSKSALDYWLGINRALVESLGEQRVLWEQEKMASVAALDTAKRESLACLQGERNRILGLSRDEALNELLQLAGLEARIHTVKQIGHGNLLGLD